MSSCFSSAFKTRTARGVASCGVAPGVAQPGLPQLPGVDTTVQHIGGLLICKNGRCHWLILVQSEGYVGNSVPVRERNPPANGLLNNDY